MENLRRKKQAHTLRIFRKAHRWSAIVLFVFFLIISVSGLLLGWKKHSGDLILPKTYKGTSDNITTWLPLDSLNRIADQALASHAGSGKSFKLDRIDIRKEKGVAKFIYSDHYWGVQVDGATGNVLHIGKRNSDLFENIHDGSILDKVLGTSNGQIKVLYSSLMGLSLLTFTVTGFWLWYGPKKMKQAVRKQPQSRFSRPSILKRA